jgi:GTP pyrophosphokinase
MKHDCDIQEIFSLMREVSDEDIELITRAYDFAEKAHEGQLRKSGEPYFIHVFAVGKNLASFGMDARTISAGLMHDVLEDTAVTEEEMEKMFGKEIVFLVNGVTKLGTLKYRGRERHVESLRKFFVAMAEDIRVLMIKLADRLHNVSTLQHVRPDKSARIALETIEVHASLANRLGMGKLKGELEDYAFPFAFPKEYEKVQALLAERTDISQKNLEQVYHKLRDALDQWGVQNAQIDYRIKHSYSLYRKLEKYNWDMGKIYDIVALRVIVPTVSDCYQVLGLVHDSGSHFLDVSKTILPFQNQMDTKVFTLPSQQKQVSLKFKFARKRCMMKQNLVSRHTFHTKNICKTKTITDLQRNLHGLMNSKKCKKLFLNQVYSLNT